MSDYFITRQPPLPEDELITRTPQPQSEAAPHHSEPVYQSPEDFYFAEPPLITHPLHHPQR